MNLKKITDHVIQYEILYVMALALILGAVGGGWLRMAVHRCPECPKCPELVARSHAERDSVGPQRDTVRVIKYVQAVTVTTTPSRDTAQRPVVTWDVVDTMIDKAVIGVSVSSAWLPMPVPFDLTHSVRYLAPPERIRVISDTLTVQLPPSECPSRWQREVVVGGICFGIGAIATAAYFTFR